MEPTFAKVTINNPLVSIKTKNSANYGAIELRLVTTLANYPKKTAFSNFIVTVYSLNVG